MTHRGPFQPLPFCDSVSLVVSCRESSPSTSTNPFRVQIRVDLRRERTTRHQALFRPSVCDNFPAPQGQPGCWWPWDI